MFRKGNTPWNKLSRDKKEIALRANRRRADALRLADPELRKKRDEQSSRWWKKARKENWAAYIIIQVRARAKKRGTKCTITAADLVVPTHCPVLGILLEVGGAKNNPNGPSVDRIDNALGYVPGNVAVISYRANRIKGDATPEELRRIADFYSR